MDHIRWNGSRIFRFAMLLCLLSFALGVNALAGPNVTSGRRLKVKVQPEYPELARRLNMKGTVRVEVQIAPDGRIRNIKVLGGSPVLVQAVEDAVRKWRYEPASTETTLVLRFDFSPVSSSP